MSKFSDHFFSKPDLELSKFFYCNFLVPNSFYVQLSSIFDLNYIQLSIWGILIHAYFVVQISKLDMFQSFVLRWSSLPAWNGMKYATTIYLVMVTGWIDVVQYKPVQVDGDGLSGLEGFYSSMWTRNLFWIFHVSGGVDGNDLRAKHRAWGGGEIDHEGSTMLGTGDEPWPRLNFSRWKTANSFSKKKSKSYF